jgi:hypothetical protein
VNPDRFNVSISLGLPSEFEVFLASTVSDATAIFPNCLSAIKGLALAAQERWIAYAGGETLPDGKRINNVSGTYAASIKITLEPPNGTDLIRYVIFSDDPKAGDLEHGSEPWDMKSMLYTSHKVRQSKKGTRYLIIPFRWGKPGTLGVGAYVGREMPKPVSSFWASRGRQSSMITGQYQQKSLQDDSTNVTRRSYQWGDRLTAKDISNLGLDPSTGAGRNMVGMVRMRNPDNARLGSQHMTFRTMSENSTGWKHPGTEARNVASAVANFIESTYEQIMRTALDADVQRLQGLS